MRRPIRKRSYLLLEVLCSLALISLVLFPLLKPCIELYTEKRLDYLQLKEESLQRRALAAFKEKLYLQEIPFIDLREGEIIDFPVGDQVCHAALHVMDRTEKTSLHRVGLLLQVELSCRGMPPSFHLIFIEGVTT